ncbi:MAG: hypothetical protein ACXWQJ_14145 [Bdellovibrionota bacterium]
MQNSNISFLSLLFLTAFSVSAQAATRTAYFDQSGVNSSITGFSQANTARCRISISNPSSADQIFTLIVYATSTNAPTANGSLAGTAPTGWVGSPSGNFANPGTLTGITVQKNGGMVTYDFTYPALTTGANQTQYVFCRGSISVQDAASGTPGFLVASGVLVTFSESSVQQTTGMTTATTAFGGTAIFSQIPVSINRGKPF